MKAVKRKILSFLFTFSLQSTKHPDDSIWASSSGESLGIAVLSASPHIIPSSNVSLEGYRFLGDSLNRAADVIRRPQTQARRDTRFQSDTASVPQLRSRAIPQ